MFDDFTFVINPLRYPCGIHSLRYLKSAESPVWGAGVD